MFTQLTSIFVSHLLEYWGRSLWCQRDKDAWQVWLWRVQTRNFCSHVTIIPSFVCVSLGWFKTSEISHYLKRGTFSYRSRPFTHIHQWVTTGILLNYSLTKRCLVNVTFLFQQSCWWVYNSWGSWEIHMFFKSNFLQFRACYTILHFIIQSPSRTLYLSQAELHCSIT